MFKIGDRVVALVDVRFFCGGCPERHVVAQGTVGRVEMTHPKLRVDFEDGQLVVCSHDQIRHEALA